MEKNKATELRNAQDSCISFAVDSEALPSSSQGNDEKINIAAPVQVVEEEKINVVDWENADDPQNPMNYSPLRKWSIIVLVSAITFNTSMASTIFAPGVPAAQMDFHNHDSAVSTLLVSIYIVGLVVGPLFLSPASELYGRSSSIHVSNIVFLIASVLSAVAVNVAMLLVFRLVMGIVCAVPLTIGGGIVADLIEKEYRGRALSIWIIGPLLGPVLGPAMGGYISLNVGWRWTIWLVAILAGVLTLASFFIFRETYGPRILQLKTQRLRKETGNSSLRSKFDKGQKPGQIFWMYLSRPTKMLLCVPIVTILSLYVAIMYGYMYILFTTFTEVFETKYGFNSGEAGLAYFGLGFGFLFGQAGLGQFSDRYLKRQSMLHGQSKPEDRLPPIMIGAVSMAIGLVWYGWTVQYSCYWIVPIIGSAFCSFGTMFVFTPVQMYLIDAYTIYAASAIGASTVMRSISGTVLPLAGPPLYNRLGYGWGNSVLAFIALAFVPLSLLLVRYGEALRRNPRFQLQL